MGEAANEFVVGGIGVGSGEDEIGLAVGRGYHGPAAAGELAGVIDEMEAELLDVKIHAAIEVANEDGDGLEAEKGVVAGGERSVAIGGAGHGRYYKPGCGGTGEATIAEAGGERSASQWK